MKTIKLSETAKKEIKQLFIDSANITKKEFYNQPYPRREDAKTYFIGVLEGQIKCALDLDIREAWEILKDTIYHKD